MISFRVNGTPRGQPRPRAFAMKLGNGKYSARVFDSGTAEGWKSLIAASAVNHRPIAPIVGPVSLRLVFSFDRPKNHYVRNNPANCIKPDAPVYHVSRPDSDNCAKAVLDCITQLGGFWKDDSQVSRLESWKLYAEHEKPGVLIEISAIEKQAAA